MHYKRNEDGNVVLVINAHGSAAPLYEIEPTITVFGPCLCFYQVRGEGDRELVMTLTKSACIGFMRFLPSLINESSRMQYRRRRQQR